jgi:hypothetical protein
MTSTATPSPDTISDSEFHHYLETYPACVAAVSDAKGGRHIHLGLHSAGF